MNFTELRKLEDVLHRATESPEPVVQNFLTYSLVGGKRLRATLVALSASFYPHELKKVTQLAASIELIHLASLIHDDILDQADTRRFKPALFRLCGRVPAILTGDYFFATAFCLLIGMPERIMRIVSNAARLMCEGEILELKEKNFSEEAYYSRVYKKTAALIIAACQSGGILCGLNSTQLKGLQEYGLHLGTAYQIADDVLDFLSSPDSLGKPCLQDLSQGILTLPVLRFLNISPEADFWKEKLRQGNLLPEEKQELAFSIKKTGSLAYAVNMVEEKIELALSALQDLPPGRARERMAEIARGVMAPLQNSNHADPAQGAAEKIEMPALRTSGL